MEKIVELYLNGNIRSIEIRNKDGKRHNPDGIAFQGWHKNGQEEYREYYIHGKLHNPDGFASQWWNENGQKSYRAYWIDGKALIESEFNERKNTTEVLCDGKNS